jgi:hypothetical protein
MSESLNTGEAASRALRDPEFAKAIVEGREDYPEVRQAILEELANANQGQDVQGFMANPTLASQTLSTYIASGPKPGGTLLINLVNRSGLRAPAPDAW